MIPPVRGTQHVIDRCPTCGVEHDIRVRDCEACHTPLRPWCRLHGNETGWLDAPVCPLCARAAVRRAVPRLAPAPSSAARRPPNSGKSTTRARPPKCAKPGKSAKSRRRTRPSPSPSPPPRARGSVVEPDRFGDALASEVDKEITREVISRSTLILATAAVIWLLVVWPDFLSGQQMMGTVGFLLAVIVFVLFRSWRR